MSEALVEIKLYFAYTSPYTYLAMEPAYALEQSHRVRLRFIPFAVKIRHIYDDTADRSERNRNKLKYLYRDVRRFANERGITIRAPQRIFNARLVATAGLFAMKAGKFRPFSDRVFERFFKRELDVEDRAAVGAVLQEVGLDAQEFERYAAEEGPTQLAQGFAEGERDNIFGVPTFLVEGEPFWGNDRVDWVIKKLDQMGLRR
ncbi:MAG TPA: DsbA family protein [Candidatus Binataceae bacterium]|nr:DsbA family protein [Candidatus Binataceae bacterium]